jgi:hypothetical protein
MSYFEWRINGSNCQGGGMVELDQCLHLQF